MIETLSALAPWIAMLGGAVTGIGGIAVAIVKGRSEKATAALAHDGLVAPPLLQRVEKLEARLDDCEKRHDACEQRVRETVEIAGKAKARAEDLEGKVVTLREMIERRTEDLTGKFRVIAEEAIEEARSSPPPKPLNLPPPRKP